MESYVCSNCKYRFKTQRVPSRCPYCDKSAIEKEKSAAEIIDEIQISE
jgi:predicted Zn-ribbon and HTH transcriptional regulator